jgi:hypothetical protein
VLLGDARVDDEMGRSAERARFASRLNEDQGKETRKKKKKIERKRTVAD